MSFMDRVGYEMFLYDMCFKSGPTPASYLFIFVLFNRKFYRKNCWLQRGSNSDLLNGR